MENDILQLILEKLNALEQGQTKTNLQLEETNSRLERVEQKVTKIEVTLENETNRNINLLLEGHKGIYEKLDGLPEKIAMLQDDTHLHNVAITELAKRTASK